MAKPKQLWNVSGVLKSFTDAKGVYRVVEPWTGPKTGAIEALPDDIERLMKNGFTDQDPNPKDGTQKARHTRLVRKVEAEIVEEPEGDN